MLTVAFDGTNYAGWQIQPNKETIEGVLNRALSRLLKEDIKVIGASRTDAGVHAEGAVCVFDTEARIPGEKFSYALNQTLPADIRIRASKEVELDFHPRRVNSRKTYRYRIRHDEFINPMDVRYSHHIYTKLDIAAMQKACEYIVGKHDFKAFCSAHTDVETTVRTVYDVHIDVTPDKKLLQMSGMMKSRGVDDVTSRVKNVENLVDSVNLQASASPEVAMKVENLKGVNGGENPVSNDWEPLVLDPRKTSSIIDIYVTGNGFLYNMVRIIAGTLIDVGQGKISPEDIPSILESCDREKAGPTAPAKGLTLMGYRMSGK